MDDKRNEQNKKIEPAQNKGGCLDTAGLGTPQRASARLLDHQPTRQPRGLVRIRFFPMRACEGVAQDAEGYATVDEALAAHLIKIKYAVKAEE